MISPSAKGTHTMFATPTATHKMLVDYGSSVDILYFQAFKRMRLKVRDLKPAPNLVYGFTRDSIILLGVISLPITLGEYPR